MSLKQKVKGIHHPIHLNVNSLLAKIDETRYIAACTIAAVIRISESKFDETILQLEIQISNYELFRVIGAETAVEVSITSYIRSDIGYLLTKILFSEGNRKYFLKILLPKTKPLIVEIIYRSPNQSNFLEILNANFDKLAYQYKREIYS